VTGWCDRTAVGAYLSSAHIYAQTSRWEGLPISVIQAMAAGLPCVVNDCIGNRDAVTDNVTGFVCSTPELLAEATLRLLGDVGLRNQLGAAARVEAALRFGQDAFGAQVRAVYQISTLDQIASPLTGETRYVVSA
jgi:glycosyltransferase involved in cell wall biosynthesis